jgi:hypothetical protein
VNELSAELLRVQSLESEFNRLYPSYSYLASELAHVKTNVRRSQAIENLIQFNESLRQLKRDAEKFASDIRCGSLASKSFSEIAKFIQTCFEKVCHRCTLTCVASWKHHAILFSQRAQLPAVRRRSSSTLVQLRL